MEGMNAGFSVGIERGKIHEKKAGPLYTVESYDKQGVITRWMEAMHNHDADQDENKEYEIGEAVFFFMFPDGRGMIIGRMRRD